MAASTMIKKTFADTMKEQDWITDMSVQGKALIGYSGGTYAFVDDEPGSWQYLVEIMGTGKKAQEAYLSFLEEMGVEVVASYAGRAYLRKKNDGTPFDLHSDGESRFDQAKKAATTWTAIPITPGGDRHCDHLQQPACDRVVHARHGHCGRHGHRASHRSRHRVRRARRAGPQARA